jgi:hypothetical protein
MIIKITNKEFQEEANMMALKIINFNKFKERFIEKMNDEQSEDGSTFLNNFMKTVIIEISEDDLDGGCIVYDENLL